MTFGILPLIIKLFSPKATFRKYQVNRQVIPSNWSDDKIRTKQYYCERMFEKSNLLIDLVTRSRGYTDKTPKF